MVLSTIFDAYVRYPNVDLFILIDNNKLYRVAQIGTFLGF